MKLVIASSDLVSGIKHAAHEVGRSKDGTLYMTVENGAKPTITFYGNGTKSEAEGQKRSVTNQPASFSSS